MGRMGYIECVPSKRKPCRGVRAVFQYQQYDAKGLHVVNTIDLETGNEGMHLAYMTDSKSRKGEKHYINFCPFCGIDWRNE